MTTEIIKFKEWSAAVGLILDTCLLIFGGWFGASYFEARAYNRATGAEVSTWDAMFIQLRVMTPARSPE